MHEGGLLLSLSFMYLVIILKFAGLTFWIPYTFLNFQNITANLTVILYRYNSFLFHLDVISIIQTNLLFS